MAVIDIKERLKIIIARNMNERMERERLQLEQIFAERGDYQLRYMYNLFQRCSNEQAG